MPYKWNFQLSSDIQVDDDLAASIHRVFLDGFGLSYGWSIDGIKKSLVSSSVVGLLEDNNEISGYAIYVVPQLLLNDKSFIWEDAICLMKKAQGQHYSSIAWDKICSLYELRKFGWIGGRTQNPAIIRRYGKLGHLFPFDELYSTQDGKLIMDFLVSYIPEVRNVSSLDGQTGICRQVYREGKLGDYPVSISDAYKYEQYLSNCDFQRERGDAVVTVSRLNQPI